MSSDIGIPALHNLPMCNVRSPKQLWKCTILIANGTHPLKVVITSTLCGPCYNLERTVHFDGFGSA